MKMNMSMVMTRRKQCYGDFGNGDDRVSCSGRNVELSSYEIIMTT